MNWRARLLAPRRHHRRERNRRRTVCGPPCCTACLQRLSFQSRVWRMSRACPHIGEVLYAAVTWACPQQVPVHTPETCGLEDEHVAANHFCLDLPRFASACPALIPACRIPKKVCMILRKTCCHCPQEPTRTRSYFDNEEMH